MADNSTLIAFHPEGRACMFNYLSCFNLFLDGAFSLICPTWIHIDDERIELHVAWSKKIIYYERDRNHYCYYYINFV